MATIHINGKMYSGNSVSVSRNKIVIDGKEVPDDENKVINIHVEGSIDTLKVDSCNKIKAEENVGELSTVSGDVKVKGDVYGDVRTVSGDVDCGEVTGNIKTVSGDVKNKKKEIEKTNTKITIDALSKLKSFGMGDDGTFTDVQEFNIVPNKLHSGEIEWHLMMFCEVDGSTYHIKRLRSMEDLKRVYEAISDRILK